MQLPALGLKFLSNSLLLSASSDGFVHRWNISPHQPSSSVTVLQTEEELLCLDANDSVFVLGGKDGFLRLYDLHSTSLLHDLSGRVSGPALTSTFSARFHPQDANIMVTGGWDRELRVWDVRSGTETAIMSGPLVCGDSIDIDMHNVLVGAWMQNAHTALQVYDLRHLKNEPVCIDFGHPSSAYLYAARFCGTAKKSVAAGGSGTNDARVFQRDPPHTLTGIATPSSGGAVQSMEAAAGRAVLAVGCSHGSVNIFSLS